MQGLEIFEKAFFEIFKANYIGQQLFTQYCYYGKLTNII